MARGYVSVNGKTANCKKAYLVKGGRTYKGVKAYVVKNGKTCLSWSGSESGEIVVTKSGDVTIPTGVTSVDIFCVGGGGGAGGWFYADRYDSEWNNNYDMFYGGGGGGGYTSTVFDVPVTPGETLTVTIGAGGQCGRSYYYYSDPDGSDSRGSDSALTNGGAGGTTSVKRNGTTLCSASGGSGGEKANPHSGKGGNGGDGGSGGCAGGYDDPSYYGTDLVYNGGVNGGNGDNGYDTTGGTGQGSTTRAFGESNGTLYSDGGDGAGSKSTTTANSGNGANVAIGYGVDSSGNVTRYGASGVAIIRWKEREV